MDLFSSFVPSESVWNFSAARRVLPVALFPLPRFPRRMIRKCSSVSLKLLHLTLAFFIGYLKFAELSFPSDTLNRSKNIWKSCRRFWLEARTKIYILTLFFLSRHSKWNLLNSYKVYLLIDCLWMKYFALCIRHKYSSLLSHPSMVWESFVQFPQ